MKKILYILIGISVISSCNDDYLDISREGQIPAEQFFQDEDDALAATNAMYSNLRSWEVAAFASFIITIASDNAEKGSSPGDGAFFNDINNFTHTSSAFIINDYWKGQWRGVNLANQVITNVPSIEMDENLKNKLFAAPIVALPTLVSS